MDVSQLASLAMAMTSAGNGQGVNIQMIKMRNQAEQSVVAMLAQAAPPPPSQHQVDILV